MALTVSDRPCMYEVTGVMSKGNGSPHFKIVILRVLLSKYYPQHGDPHSDKKKAPHSDHGHCHPSDQMVTSVIILIYCHQSNQWSINVTISVVIRQSLLSDKREKSPLTDEALFPTKKRINVAPPEMILVALLVMIKHSMISWGTPSDLT